MLNNLNANQYQNVYMACGYTDLRLGIDGLASIVQSRFHLNPLQKRTLFLFCGRRADRIKGLLWEGGGFLLLYKRLEDGKFQWPRNTDEVMQMNSQQFRWLMEGLSVIQKRLVKEVHPRSSF